MRAKEVRDRRCSRREPPDDLTEVIDADQLRLARIRRIDRRELATGQQESMEDTGVVAVGTHDVAKIVAAAWPETGEAPRTRRSSATHADARSSAGSALRWSRRSPRPASSRRTASSWSCVMQS